VADQRRLLLMRWYSMCSMHSEVIADCQRCRSGHWLFEPKARFVRWRFNRKHHVVNGQWVERSAKRGGES